MNFDNKFDNPFIANPFVNPISTPLINQFADANPFPKYGKKLGDISSTFLEYFLLLKRQLTQITTEDILETGYKATFQSIIFLFNVLKEIQQGLYPENHVYIQLLQGLCFTWISALPSLDKYAIQWKTLIAIKRELKEKERELKEKEVKEEALFKEALKANEAKEEALKENFFLKEALTEIQKAVEFIEPKQKAIIGGLIQKIKSKDEEDVDEEIVQFNKGKINWCSLIFILLTSSQTIFCYHETLS